jgi:hypothetical protein
LGSIDEQRDQAPFRRWLMGDVGQFVLEVDRSYAVFFPAKRRISQITLQVCPFDLFFF